MAGTTDTAGRDTEERWVDLDLLDRQIAAALQINGRAAWRQIARLLNKNEVTVARRARELIAAGYLRPTVLIDPVRCGWGRPVIVQMSCEASRTVSIATQLAERSDVRFVALVTGPFDLVAELVVPSRRALAKILIEDLAAIPGIHRTYTQAVVRNFKIGYGWARELLPEDAALPPEGVDGEGKSPVELDELDQRMLVLLRNDARSSHQELAFKLGISESAARRRLDRLVSEGCLRPVTLVDPVLLGYEVESMVWLHVGFQELEATAGALAEHAGVRYLSATVGFSDLVAETVLRDQEDLYRFHTEVLGSMPGVRDAETAIELFTVKRAYLLNTKHKTGSDQE